MRLPSVILQLTEPSRSWATPSAASLQVTLECLLLFPRGFQVAVSASNRDSAISHVFVHAEEVCT